MAKQPNKFKKNLPDDQPNEPKQQTCQASGCPLFGTRSTSLNGSDKWWCRFHYGQELSNFARITDRITRSRPMIEHIRRLKQAVSADIVNPPPWMTSYPNNPEFSRREDETHGQYIARLEAALQKAIRQGIEHSKLEGAKELVSGFTETTRLNGS